MTRWRFLHVPPYFTPSIQSILFQRRFSSCPSCYPVKTPFFFRPSCYPVKTPFFFIPSILLSCQNSVFSPCTIALGPLRPCRRDAGGLSSPVRHEQRVFHTTRHAGNAAVQGLQGPVPRLYPAVPHGRLLRDVLRGRENRQQGVGAHPDLAEQGPHGRPAGGYTVSRPGQLPRPAGQGGIPRGHLRAGRGPQAGKGPGQARRCPPGYTRHVDRRGPARAAPGQLPGGRLPGRRRREGRRAGRTGMGGTLQRGLLGHDRTGRPRAGRAYTDRSGRGDLPRGLCVRLAGVSGLSAAVHDGGGHQQAGVGL